MAQHWATYGAGTTAMKKKANKEPQRADCKREATSLRRSVAKKRINRESRKTTDEKRADFPSHWEEEFALFRRT